MISKPLFVIIAITVMLAICALQQSANALRLLPIIKANLEHSPYMPDVYILKNLQVTNKTSTPGTTYNIVGNTAEPEISVSPQSEDVAFVGKIAIIKGQTTEYSPLTISMVAVNKTVDPKTHAVTVGFGGVGSYFNWRVSEQGVGKMVLTNDTKTSTLFMKAAD